MRNSNVLRQEPKPGEFYNHFKNMPYQILNIAIHSETREKLVIYQALYGTYKVYARPLDMFMSEVDKEKYPFVNATYRFEKVTYTEQASKQETIQEEIQEEIVNLVKTESNSTNQETSKVNPLLLEFLDTKSYEEKLILLSYNKTSITNELIDAMAASIDCTVEDGELDSRINSFFFCLQTLGRFEKNRLR